MISEVITHPAGKYMFKVNNRNTRTRCEICSKVTIKTTQRRRWDYQFKEEEICCQSLSEPNTSGKLDLTV